MKIFTTITVLLFSITFIIFGILSPVDASVISDDSARLKISIPVEEANNSFQDILVKSETVRKVLQKYNSPLTGETSGFISACLEQNIDCYLLPSISGLESTYGKFTHTDSYNPFGWGGGYILFDSWSEGFHAVAKGLNENYFSRGADSIETIGPIYAASPTWSVRVASIHSEFLKTEQSIIENSYHSVLLN